MNPLAALLVFVGIPVLFCVVVYVLVSASSWTRSGRTTADFEEGPFMVVSDTAAPDPSHLPREFGDGPEALVGGGASAQW